MSIWQEAHEPEPLFRCIESNPPTLHDFMSSAAKGEPLRPPQNARRQRLWESVSVYDTVERANWRAGTMDPPRRWIAVLEPQATEPIVVEKTMQDPNHYSLWGTPQALLDCVTSVLESWPGEG